MAKKAQAKHSKAKTKKQLSEKKLAEICAQCGNKVGKDRVAQDNKTFCCQLCCDNYIKEQENPNVCRFC